MREVAAERFGSSVILRHAAFRICGSEAEGGEQQRVLAMPRFDAN